MKWKQSLETDLPERADVFSVVQELESMPGVKAAHIITLQRIRVYFNVRRITPAEILQAALKKSKAVTSKAPQPAPVVLEDETNDETVEIEQEANEMEESCADE